MSIRASLHISDVLDTYTHRPLVLRDVPLEENISCVCCGTRLVPCAQIRADVSRVIRIGRCSACGYVGYMDRPQEAWLQAYYNSEWDKPTAQRVEDIRMFKPNRIIGLAGEHGLPREASVFEVGTGYGQLLQQFRSSGYARLFGIEHSAHRAEAASRYAAARVLHGPFGTPETAERLREFGPMDLVFSKSVMEHMHDPAKLFSAAAPIQPDGGLLLISVPNVWHEATYITLFFLPHLHAFTRVSLWNLAAQNGYAPVEVVKDGKGLILVARKGAAHAQMPSEYAEDVAGDIVAEKWCREFQVTDAPIGRPRIFWWAVTDAARTGTVPFPSRLLKNPLVLSSLRRLSRSAFFAPLLRIVFGLPKRHGAFVTTVESREPAETSMLTIEIEPLRLFLK